MPTALKKFWGVGRLGGYGVYSDQGISLSSHMPIGMKQTNNAAELMAALCALQTHPVGTIAICSDPQYVLLGVGGAARRWKIKGWAGSPTGLAVSRIMLFQTQLIPTGCQICYHSDLWDHCSTGQL